MGAILEAFKTTVFPADNAGHMVLVPICMGKFQGIIEPTTP
jgi:hypothetical protein